jgi:uncharacterized protein
MPRILLLLAVVFGVIWWLRNRAQSRKPPPEATARGAHPDARRGTPARQAPPQEAMVQCAQCGLHLPSSDAIAFRGLHYCQRAHLPAQADDGDDGGPDSRAA